MPNQIPQHQRVGVISQFKSRPKMVGWYDPGQLLRTGIDVIISSIFGRYDDRRMADAVQGEAGPQTFQPVDYTVDEQGNPRDELWLDYVSDLGDGWDSTYNVAYVVSRRSLTVRDPAGGEHVMPRANVLVFGGDEVYPVATRDMYRDRLIRPYEGALRDSAAPHPHVFAVPGNHDWYDNLVSFTSLFCTGRWFAGWRTQQKRSYFSAKLPHGWWLIGTDMQLQSDIDATQLAYFRKIAEQMEPDDRVILCVAEPHWVYARAYGKFDDNCNESNLAYLEERVFKRNVSVYLAGDLHHYRRHANNDGLQKITCGGGGAFLHPTHGPNVDKLSGGYTLRSAFPPPKDSRKLTWRNLLFPFTNPKFGFATAAVYLLLAWAVNVDVSMFGLPQYGTVVHRALTGLVNNQIAVTWMAILIFGFIFFTESHSTRFRWIGGTLHALTHATAVCALGWWATLFTVRTLGLEFGSISQLLTAGALIYTTGWLVGPMIMGIYFIISLNCLGRHSNEAFSSLRCADWKSFLRIKVTRDAVTIFPVGLRKVWKSWVIHPGGSESPEWIPDESAPPRKRGTPPALIEQPIVVTKA